MTTADTLSGRVAHATRPEGGKSEEGMESYIRIDARSLCPAPPTPAGTNWSAWDNWRDSLEAVIAGDTVFSGTHVWTASTDTAERAHWLGTLGRIEALKPNIVVPGHLRPGLPLTLAAVTHTRGYLEAFDAVASSTRKSDEIVRAMTAKYPNAGLGVVLDLGAKVAAGEMPKWD